MEINKEEIKEQTQGLQDAFVPDDLSCSDEHKTYIWNVICQKTEFNEDNADYGNGATKFVIIPKDKDYVIKFPFLYLYEYKKHYYNRTLHQWDGEPKYSRLTHDYCDIEEDNFYIAKNEFSGAETFLAKTNFICSYNCGNESLMVYAQEKATPFYDYCKQHDICDYHWDKLEEISHSYKEYDESSSIDAIFDYGYYDEIPGVWFEKLYDYAVEHNLMNEVEQLFRFLLYADISDLNIRNVGFIGDKPVLIDYSGFEEE